MITETKRIVEYTEGNAGIWSATCEACPLKVHTDALGQKTPNCAHGIATNMQGPIVFGTCKNYRNDSMANEGKSLTVVCEYPAEKEPS